jgi:hypothetical protein
MDENEPLLDEGAVATLQKVVIQASSIFTKLSVEGVEAANSYAAATRVPTEAIRDPVARPRRVSELEPEKEQLHVIYERKNRIIDDFNAFIRRAEPAYEERASEIE